MKTKLTYWEQLKDPRWQKRRLEVMGRDEFRCQLCFDDTKTLNVHHRWYEKSRDIWNYPDESLITLCEECHQEEHDAEIRLKKLLAEKKWNFSDVADAIRNLPSICRGNDRETSRRSVIFSPVILAEAARFKDLLEVAYLRKVEENTWAFWWSPEI